MQVRFTNEMCVRVITGLQVVFDALSAIWTLSRSYVVLVSALVAFAIAVSECRVLTTGSHITFGTTDGTTGTIIIIGSFIACLLLSADLLLPQSGSITEDPDSPMPSRSSRPWGYQFFDESLYGSQPYDDIAKR